jgi:hypothetical protein
MNLTTSTDLALRAATLLEQQKHEWDVLRGGYESLLRIETRTLAFEGYQVELQFNPGRIASSAAKVDAKSISQRPCFLCPQNRPPEQRGIALHDNLVLLCNPFPIFPEHFTIPLLQHVPQRILPSFGMMLDLARELQSRYTVFYTGARCGASAPDHLHLQAGSRNFVPVDREYPSLPKRMIARARGVEACAVDGYLRRMIALQGGDREAIVAAFGELHAILRALDGGDEEPMVNLFASFAAGQWSVFIFPRGRHRPAAYFAEGDAQMLLSPGAVDMGGLCIIPVERDFRRLTREDLVQMFDEVTLEAAAFEQLVGQLRRTLA